MTSGFCFCGAWRRQRPGELVLGAQAIEIAEPPHPSNLEATAAVTSLDSTSAPHEKAAQKAVALANLLPAPKRGGPRKKGESKVSVKDRSVPKAWKDVELCVPKQPFERLCKEVFEEAFQSHFSGLASDGKTVLLKDVEDCAPTRMHLSKSAIAVLHTAFEEYGSCLFTDASTFATHANRTGVGLSDLRLVTGLRSGLLQRNREEAEALWRKSKMAWLRKFVLPPSVSGAAGLAVKPVGCRETFSILFLCPQAHLICSLGQLWGVGGGISSRSKGHGFRPLRPEDLQN